MIDRTYSYFQKLALYNKLANHRLYSVCAQLTDEERKVNRQVFFRSIHGTLNHILIGDRIWMMRFQGVVIPSTNLDSILYDNFDELWEARQEEDESIENFMAELDEIWLESEIDYVNNEGKEFSDETTTLLIHFFNHQTHHRGQVHAMITQTNVKPPVLDLHRVLKPNP